MTATKCHLCQFYLLQIVPLAGNNLQWKFNQNADILICNLLYIYVAVLPSSMEETTPISKSKDRNYGKWKYNAININTALVRINHQSIRTVTQENTRPSYGPRWLIGLVTNASSIGIRIEVPTLYMELYNKNIYLGFILILHYTPVIVIDDEVSMTTFWTKFPTPTIVCQAVASCC